MPNERMGNPRVGAESNNGGGRGTPTGHVLK